MGEEAIKQAIESLSNGVNPGAGMWGMLGGVLAFMAALIWWLLKNAEKREERFITALDNAISKMGEQRKEDRAVVVEMGRELRTLGDVCSRRNLKPIIGDSQ